MICTLEGSEDDSIRIETCCPHTKINIIKFCRVSLKHRCTFRCIKNFGMANIRFRRSNGDNYISLTPTSIIHSYTHMSRQSYKQTHDSQTTTRSNCRILLKMIKGGRCYCNVGNVTSTATVSYSRSLPVIPLYYKTAQTPHNIP